MPGFVIFSVFSESLIFGINVTGLFIKHSSKLIDTAEGRAVFGCDHVCTDTPGGDGSALCFQAVNQVFVQVAGSGDDRVGKAGFIEQLAGLFGHVGEVAAVKTDTIALQILSGCTHFLEDTDCVWHAGTQAYRTYRREAGRHSDTARNTF